MRCTDSLSILLYQICHPEDTSHLVGSNSMETVMILIKDFFPTLPTLSDSNTCTCTLNGCTKYKLGLWLYIDRACVLFFQGLCHFHFMERQRKFSSQKSWVPMQIDQFQFYAVSDFGYCSVTTTCMSMGIPSSTTHATSC